MSLASHNTRVFFWATLLGSVNFMEPVMALFYLHRGLTPTQIFFTLTAYSIVPLFFEVPTGAFADRYGPRASFMVGSLFGIGSMLLLMTVPQTWAIFAANSLWALGHTFFSGADEALIYESLKESGEEGQMGAVMGRIASAGFITLAVSHLAGPLLAKDLSEPQFRLLIGLNLIFLTGKFLLVSRVRTPRVFDVEKANPWAHVRSALSTIRANPNLFLLFVNTTLAFIPTYVFTRFDPPYLTGAGLPPTYLGLLYASGSLLSFLLSRSIGRITGRFPRVPVVAWSGLAVLGALIVAALFQSSLIAAAFAFYFVRAGRTIRNPILGHMMNEYIPSGSRSTTLSILSLLDSVADVVVVPLMATLAVFGLQAIFWACAAVVLVGLLFPVREASAAA